MILSLILAPIASDGKVLITPEDGADRSFEVRITQLQLEQVSFQYMYLSSHIVFNKQTKIQTVFYFRILESQPSIHYTLTKHWSIWIEAE
jgi:hypothetical protein